MYDGEIIARDPVELKPYLRQIVAKTYSEDLLTDTVVEKLTYGSSGLKVKGYVARPAAPGMYPVLIWNRGGNDDRGALDDLLAYLILASTAVWGYTVLATQYRGNMGSDGDGDDWGGKDLDDALHLLKVADELEFADCYRVAIEGASRGGMTTYRALREKPVFSCAMVHAGLVDLFGIMQHSERFHRYINKLFGDLSEDERDVKLRELSAVHFADKLPKDTPILLMHGDKDDTIPIKQSEGMVEQLQKHDVPHEFHVIEGGGHVALKDGSYQQIDKLRKAWLEKYV